MAVSVCRGCAKIFDSDSHIEAMYCDDRCRENEHRRLKPSKPSPPSPTFSIRAGYEALANESGKFNDYTKRMRKNVVR